MTDHPSSEHSQHSQHSQPAIEQVDGSVRKRLAADGGAESGPARPAGAAPGSRSHRASIPLYIIVGVIVTATHYAFVAIAVEVFGIWPVAATVGGFVIASVLKYVLNYSVAFRSAQPHPVTVLRYVCSLAVMLGLTTLCFTFFYEWVGLHYMVAQVLTTGLMIPPGYLLSRQFVFVRKSAR